MMRKRLAIMVLPLLLLSCDNKVPKSERDINDEQPAIELTMPDTVAEAQEKETKKDEERSMTKDVKPSSSYSNKSSDDDNMRGFDPASEEDMPDNGMKRYMENNDDEGWE
jgi:hypothetical protein